MKFALEQFLNLVGFSFELSEEIEIYLQIVNLVTDDYRVA